jgi:catechol 2,3-dioxygenase-like lactoylglutathione lyase family enzyme
VSEVPALQGIDHVALAVRDIAASVAWYREVLGFRPRFEGSWGGVPAMIALGDTMVALFPAGDAAEGPQPVTRGRPGFLHLAFRASGPDFARARGALEERGLHVEFQDHEIAHSIYFHDPDGNQLEITTYDVPQ